jgi:hypothetical protein
MSLGGWIFMVAAWSALLGAFAFCLWRTLRAKE